MRDNNTGMHLICLPYAGGSASQFRNWPEMLPPGVTVLPVQLPGRGVRLSEAPFTHVAEVVDEVFRSIQQLKGRPFALFGHSMGALISFEVARFLRRHGHVSPSHIFVSGRRAPQRPSRRSPLHALPEREFIEGMKQYNGTPSAVLRDKEFMHIILPMLRADFSVCETYGYIDEPPLSIPITVFGGTRDMETTLDELAAWRDQTTRDFTLHILPGDHFFPKSAESLLLPLVARQLNRYSARHVPIEFA